MKNKNKFLLLFLVIVVVPILLYGFGLRPVFPYTNENGTRDVRATDLYTNVFVGEVVEETGKAKVNIMLGSSEREIDAYDYRVKVQDNIVGWVSGDVNVRILELSPINIDTGDVLIFPTNYNWKSRIYQVKGFLEDPSRASEKSSSWLDLF